MADAAYVPRSLLSLIWYFVTGNLHEVRLKPGDRIEADAARVFIVTRRTGQVLHEGPAGHYSLTCMVRQGAVLSDGDLPRLSRQSYEVTW